MKMLTEDAARDKWCPYKSQKEVNRNCVTSGCMAWTEVCSEIKCEDHTGAREFLMQEASKSKYFRKIKIEGFGVTGFVSLPALGYCGKNDYNFIEEDN